jgi:hypothetical protein
MTHTRLRPPAALVLVALVVAGCSSATADTAAPTGTQAVKFSQCMRDNGVGAFPDPDASGKLTIDGIANNSHIDTNSAAWNQAIGACRKLEPAGFTGTRRSADQQAAALQFAQCIREHGVADFPDPDPDGPMVDTNRIPSSNKPGGMAPLNAAMQTCGTYAERAGITK